MTFKEILDVVYNTIDETDYDDQIEVIVKSAINEAYQSLCKEDVRLNRAYLPIINGLCTLPTNIINIVKTTPELAGGDRVIGNSVITDKSGVIELLYSYVREVLINDEDEPDLHEILVNAIPHYASYKYFSHRKKGEVANIFYGNYMNAIYEFREYIKDKTQDMTGIETIQFIG